LHGKLVNIQLKLFGISQMGENRRLSERPTAMAQALPFDAGFNPVID